MSETPDDLEAVRTITATLAPFEENDQERILRWVREKLGLPIHAIASTETTPSITESSTPAIQQSPHITSKQTNDIKTFIAQKKPSSDMQFAATVAYYYRFEATESAQRDAIASEDLQEACRLSGRNRLTNPGQTLRNATYQGLLDRADKGKYTINTVGENLVAMTLPSDSNQSNNTSPKKAVKKRSNSKKTGKEQTKPKTKKTTTKKRK